MTVANDQSTTLWHVIDRAATVWGDRDAICCGLDSGSSVSYTQLKQQTLFIANFLQRDEFEATDRVLVLLPDGFAKSRLLASLPSCCVASFLGDDIEFDAVLECIERLGVKLIISDATNTELERSIKQLGIRSIAVDALLELSLSDSVQIPQENTLLIPKDDSDCVVVRTSGTTGHGKLVNLSQRMLLLAAQEITHLLKLDSRDRLLGVAPQHHVMGISSFWASLISGGTFIALAGFNRSRINAQLVDYSPSWFSASPALHQLILDHLSTIQPISFSSLRLVRSASATLPVKLRQAMHSFWQVPVIQSYGMSETAGSICSQELTQQEESEYCVGRSLGTEVAVLEQGSGGIVAVGRGELCVKGPRVFSGYRYEVDLTPSYIGEWYRTGDDAQIDQNGVIYIYGRVDQSSDFPTEVQSDFMPDLKDHTFINNEEVILETVRRQLKNKEIDLDDNFFACGGDSLAAVNIVLELEKVFSVVLASNTIFNTPTIRELVRHIITAEAREPRKALSEEPKCHFLNEEQLAILARGAKDSDYTDLIAKEVTLDGAIDPTILVKAFEQLQYENPILCAKVQRQGKQFSLDVNKENLLQLEQVDLTAVAEQQKLSRLEEHQSVFLNSPICTESDALFKALLVRLSVDHQILCLACHHILLDEASLSKVVARFAQCYLELALGRAAVKKEALTDIELKPQSPAKLMTDQACQYWYKQLSGLELSNRLLTHEPNRSLLSNHKRFAKTLTVNLETSLFEKLIVVAKQQSITLNTLFLTVFKVFLYKLNRSVDITVACPVSDKNNDEIGMFAHLVFLRSYFSDELLINEAFENELDVISAALENIPAPIYLLRKDILNIEDLLSAPLFAWQFRGNDSKLNFGQDIAATIKRLDNSEVKTDLAVYFNNALIDQSEVLSVSWKYDQSRFSESTVTKFASSYTQLLKDVAERLGAIGSYKLIETPMMAHQPLGMSFSVDGLEDGLIERLFYLAKTTPFADALIDDHRALTYAELEVQSRMIAQGLVHSGIQGYETIALNLVNGIDRVICSLAVWMTGASILWLDADQPPKRRQSMLTDNSVATVIYTEELAGQLTEEGGGSVYLSMPELRSKAKQAPSGFVFNGEREKTKANTLSHIFYTSGTTGVPRKICIQRSERDQYLSVLQKELKTLSGDRYLATAPATFSSAFRQIALPLISGASVVMADKLIVARPTDLIKYATKHQVSVLDLTPSYLARCLNANIAIDESSHFKSLRQTLIASEPLRGVVARQWQDFVGAGVELINMYGLTEAGGIVALRKLNRHDFNDDVVAAGHALEGRQLIIEPSSKQTLNPASAGIISIEIGASEHRSNRILTGDYGLWDPKKGLFVLGRSDRIIKRSGVRISLEEIEQVILAHDDIRLAVVTYSNQQDVATDHDLVAYLLTLENANQAQILMQVRALLSDALDHTAIPTSFVFVDEAELGNMAKFNPYFLAERIGHKHRPESSSIAPSQARSTAALENGTSDVRLRIAALWQTVLELSEIDDQSNFFDLGGDSLSCLQLKGLLSDNGLELTVNQLFQYPTIAAQAALFDRSVKTRVEIPSNNNDLKFVSLAELRSIGLSILRNAGLREDCAKITVEVQIEASLRGQKTHNIEALPRYASQIKAGRINSDPQFKIEAEDQFYARLNGDNGPGQWVATLAVEHAINKCKNMGVGIVAVNGSNHFGAAGHYAWLASRQGLIGMVMTNGRAVLAPTGSNTPLLGNNPLAISFPSFDKHQEMPAFLLDMSLSAVPRSKLGLTLAQGKGMSPGWILDHQGFGSDKAADVLSGLSVPIGEHKGYGLAFAMELLAGVLSGSGYGAEHQQDKLKAPGVQADYGHLFIVLDPKKLLAQELIEQRYKQIVDDILQANRVSSQSEIRIPGHCELKSRQEHLHNGGVNISHELYARMVQASIR